MLQTTYRTGNRVDIHTGHATFDRQCDILMTGNVWGNTQFSNFIRPESELECNGIVNAPGHLRSYDLGMFTALPSFVRDAVIAATADKAAILYEIRHWVGSKRRDNRRKIVHGYLLTRTGSMNYQLIQKFMIGHTEKDYAVIQECAPYLSD
jgi:hypothetical protein